MLSQPATRPAQRVKETTRPLHSTGRPWSEHELQLLHQLSPGATWEELLAALPARNKTAIEEQASKQNPPLRRAVSVWSAEQLEILARDYPIHGAAYVANQVGRSAGTVAKKASTLGIARVVERKPAPEPKPERRSPAPGPVAAKPVVVAKPAPARPVVAPPQKKDAGTPNLNAQKGKRDKHD